MLCTPHHHAMEATSFCFSLQGSHIAAHGAEGGSCRKAEGVRGQLPALQVLLTVRPSLLASALKLTFLHIAYVPVSGLSAMPC